MKGQAVAAQKCTDAVSAVETRHDAPGVGLRAEDLSVSLAGHAVLSGVSLVARPGEIVGLIGPNGSGKTTLLRALAGLVRPSSGEVWLGSDRLAALRPAERARRIAYMAQFAERHPFSALEAVLMGRYPHLGRLEIEGPDDRRAALDAMRRTGTEGLAGRQLDTLSGGERQRVVLARAIAQGADVLLLDEPTAALDLKHRLVTMDIVRQEAARRGALAVIAAHDLSLAGRYCDRLVLLAGGRVIAAGAPSEVLAPANLRDAFEVETVVEPDPVTGRPQVTLLGAAPVGDGADAVDGPSRRPGRIGDGVRVHVICGAGSGRDIMYQLVAAGYTVTACVLGQGDTDREAAERLRLSFVPAPAFSAVTPAEHMRHLELVAAADFVALCDMAVGRNNLPNLEAAAGARRLLILSGRPFAELDYTGGEATRVYESLAASGEVIARADTLRVLARAAARAT